MEKSEICSSCGVALIKRGSTSFPCPVCGKTMIGRCPQCRDQGVAYKCKECDFKGP